MRCSKVEHGCETGGKVETSGTHTEREANSAVRQLSVSSTIGLQLQGKAGVLLVVRNNVVYGK